jgi:hypothetical protein
MSTLSARRILMLTMAIALLSATAGCIFSPDEDVDIKPKPAPTLDFPGDPATLMKNFQVIYEERSIDWYRNMLHPDYQTILQDETNQQFPEFAGIINFDQELRIHERMFSGDDLRDPVTNALVPGVIGISFGKLEPLDDWQVSPSNDPIPNAQFTTYQVDFLFDRGQDQTQISVKGNIKFYVTSRDSFHEGADRQYYQMVGQIDLTSVE